MAATTNQCENRSPIDAAQLGQRALRGILRLARLRAGQDDTPARRLEPVRIERIAACRLRLHGRR